MHWLITLTRADARLLFPDDLDPALFLVRFLRLGTRWGVTLRAFALAGREARLLVEGARLSVGHVCRLQQSGWGVWRHHRGDFLCWEPAVREWVGDTGQALEVADHLHQQAGLAWPWSSLREALELRTAGWVDPAWLRQGRSPAQVLEAARPGARLPELVSTSWRAADPLAWSVIEGALRHVTGQDPARRAHRSLRSRLAWSAGWSVSEIADRLDVQARAVSRSLALCDSPALGPARTVLRDQRLRPDWLLDAQDWATPAGLEVPCLATPRSWNELAG